MGKWHGNYIDSSKRIARMSYSIDRASEMGYLGIGNR
jgi:hypothetical protein